MQTHILHNHFLFLPSFLPLFFFVRNVAKIQLDRNVGRELIFKGKREMPWLWFWGSDGTQLHVHPLATFGVAAGHRTVHKH